MKDIRTHRGFLIARDSGEPGYIASVRFNKLLEHYRTHSDSHLDFAFITDVVKGAKELLFQGGQNLLRNQLWHPSSRWVLSFVASTLDFVNGAPRNISVVNYYDLLEFHPEALTQFDASANRDKLRQWDQILKARPEEFISLWLSREGGLNDLVHTLHLIGGDLPNEWHAHPKPLK